MIHPFTEATMVVISRKLENALTHFEQYSETHGEGVQDPKMNYSRGYRELLQIRGLLHAAQQLEAMSAEVEKADTERPAGLRLVK